jgi:hypothetical protein
MPVRLTGSCSTVPKTAVIHIGTRKTGTTSIQETLARSGAQLGTIGYPLVGADRNQNRIISLYLAQDEMPITWRDLDPSVNRRFSRVFFKHLNSANDVVISAEALSSWFSLSDIRRLRMDFEKAGFHRFRIVLYIRDPAEYYLSYTQQVLKSSFSFAPEAEHPGVFRYEFGRIARMWEEIFPDDLVVRRYPSGSGEDVVGDFCGLLREYLGVVIAVPDLRRNRSLSAEGMAILQDYRLQFPDPSCPGRLTSDAARVVSFLQASIDLLPQTKACLKADIAEGIRANHKHAADFIMERYGVDIALPRAVPRTFPEDRVYRVTDLVESFDTATVRALLLLLARSGLQQQSAKRSLLSRAVSRAGRELRKHLS